MADSSSGPRAEPELDPPLLAPEAAAAGAISEVAVAKTEFVTDMVNPVTEEEIEEIEAVRRPLEVGIASAVFVPEGMRDVVILSI